MYILLDLLRRTLVKQAKRQKSVIQLSGVLVTKLSMSWIWMCLCSIAAHLVICSYFMQMARHLRFWHSLRIILKTTCVYILEIFYLQFYKYNYFSHCRLAGYCRKRNTILCALQSKWNMAKLTYVYRSDEMNCVKVSKRQLPLIGGENLMVMCFYLFIIFVFNTY